jgi:hypothetical protein
MSTTDQFWQYARRRSFRLLQPKPTRKGKVCLSFREPGRKRHYLSDTSTSILNSRSAKENSDALQLVHR